MKYYIVINCHKFMLKKKQDNLNITASSFKVKSSSSSVSLTPSVEEPYVSM
jgi:hypothetical protein